MKPIIVGVDGSSHALVATRWAAAEAQVRHRPLDIVHCWLLIDAARYPGIKDDRIFAAWEHEARSTLDRAVEIAEAEAPGLDIRRHCVAELARPGLLAAADSAEMLFVGTQGMGAGAELLIGSTSRALAAHAPCPVVVARGDITRRGRVVVGVDGSKPSAMAAEFAFEEASWRGSELAVVHACDFPHAYPHLGDKVRGLLQSAEKSERIQVQEALAGLGQDHPDVTVVEVFVHGHPRSALLAESGRADLIVVGSRGHASLPGMLLGSVSQDVLRHADIPVAVIHG